MKDFLTQSDRTFACSVVFLDIVGYSNQPVEKQMVWKRAFNAFIENSIIGVPEDDRIILDTGDGAALSFLGDPETALISSIRIRDQLEAQPPDASSTMQVRVGINLGAVKILKDINGQPNLVGDGINVGQRIMSFAGPNEILVSRSFYEMVSPLTSQYRTLFVPGGSFADKHQREHEVFKVGSLKLPDAVPCTPRAPEASTAKAEDPKLSKTTAPDPAVQSAIPTLEKCLSPFVGPIAGMLVNKTVRNDPGASLPEIVKKLIESIPPGRERDSFTRTLTAQLPSEAQTLTEPTTTTSAPAQPISITAEEQQGLEKLYAQHLGPMGSVLIKREVSKHADSSALLAALAEHIGNEKEKKAFLASGVKIFKIK